VANGADLSLIEVEVVDANGNRCPTALNLISFNMTGPAEWRGGIAQGPDNYILSRELPVECGVNRFLVRSTMMPGKISITASANGLQPASLQLESKPFTVQDGLSREMPDENLKPSLLRDPRLPALLT